MFLSVGGSVGYTRWDRAKLKLAFPLGARCWICIWIQLWGPRFMPLWALPSRVFFPWISLSQLHSLSHRTELCWASHIVHIFLTLFLGFYLPLQNLYFTLTSQQVQQKLLLTVLTGLDILAVNLLMYIYVFIIYTYILYTHIITKIITIIFYN